MNDQPRMVKLCDLWQRESAKTGKTYFSGYAGPVQYLLFDAGMQPHPTRPDEEVHIWRLLVQESDPDRRPAPKRIGADPDPVVISRESSARRIKELAGAFDRHGPDDKLPF